MASPFDAINPDVYKAYVFWSAVLVAKMLLMSPLTGMLRFKNKGVLRSTSLLASVTIVKKTRDSLRKRHG